MLHDLHFGLRLLKRAPGFSAVAVLVLGLGIGANTAVFSVINTVLIGKLPVADPDGLVQFVHHIEARKLTSPWTPYTDVPEWRRLFQSMEHISAWQPSSGNLAAGGEPERILLGKTSHTFWRMVGVRPALGRAFLPEEDRPGGGRVLLLTHELWQRHFGGRASALGSTARLDGVPHTIVGVLPPRFRFVGDDRMDAYAPLALPEAGPVVPVAVFGRLKAGVSAAQREAELEAATRATKARLKRYPARLRTRPLESQWIDPDVRGSLWVLLAGVGLVLLIACANVASLLLSRAAARRREIAVRAALGAGRWRLIRQFMVESLPLAALGGAAGVLLASWGVALLPGLDVSRIPRLGEVRIDGRVLAFTAGVSLLTLLLCALAPALALSRARVDDALKEGGRGTAGPRGSRLRNGLVVVEVALALLLSIGAVLMIRTFYRLTNVHPGFNPAGVLSASVELPRNQYRTPEEVARFYGRLLEDVKALPGVRSACLANSLPLSGRYFRGTFFVEGRDYEPGEHPILDTRTVDAGYLRTLEAPLRRGRFFTERDRPDSEPVLVINETTARRYFGGADPIGRRMGNPRQWARVVGVVADVRHTDVARDGLTEVLVPFFQKPEWGATLAVRVAPALYPEPEQAAPLVRRAVRRLDANLAVFRVAAMETTIAVRLGARRLNMLLLAVFAGIAMLLAAVGIYGVLSFAVERRTHEIGVRMALGADARHMVRTVVRQAMQLVAAGVVLGLAAAAALTRLLASMLYGVSATDPAVFTGAAAALAAVAAVACWLPARRATRVDPLAALRWE